jgi:exopolyphosphatase/guanosine-5'-triphosphate,3'-diphosphate pyrophosphatase
VRLATIDIGTNTTLLLIADVTDKTVRVIAERAEITRLGRGIGSDGRLGRAGIERTLAVLADFAALSRGHGATMFAIGTEALRRAPNASDFLTVAIDILGKPIEVIDGDREATLTFLAAKRSFPEATRGTSVVVDIGGGSTEIILALAGQIVFRHSLPIGSVRLTEQFIHTDPALASEVTAVTDAIDQHLLNVPFPPPPLTLIGTAGTVTSLAAMALGLSSYDPKLVHGHRLSLDVLERELTHLRASTQTEREKMAGLDPKRADVILAGACILSCIARRAHVADYVLVNDRGIRWGLLFEKV